MLGWFALDDTMNSFFSKEMGVVECGCLRKKLLRCLASATHEELLYAGQFPIRASGHYGLRRMLTDAIEKASHAHLDVKDGPLNQ